MVTRRQKQCVCFPVILLAVSFGLRFMYMADNYNHLSSWKIISGLKDDYKHIKTTSESLQYSMFESYCGQFSRKFYHLIFNRNTEYRDKNFSDGKCRQGYKRNVLDYSDMCTFNTLAGYTDLTNCQHSKIELVAIQDQQVTVKVTTYSKRDMQQTKGGDVILIWAESMVGDKVSGTVTDFNNGIYIGVVSTYWHGETVIKAKLAATIENACLKLAVREQYGDALFLNPKQDAINGKYRNTNGEKESTLCSPSSNIYSFKTTCNYTNRNGGLPWFCGQPLNKNLHCSNIVSFGRAHWPNATHILKYSSVLRTSCTLPNVIRVWIKNATFNKSDMPCSNTVARVQSWLAKSAGYWYGQTQSWQMTGCKGLANHTTSSYRECLNDKTIVFIGDSTVRQYVEYLIEFVFNEKQPNLKPCRVNGSLFQDLRVFSKYNISFMYRRHAMPFSNNDCAASGITSYWDEAVEMSHWSVSGKDIILLLNCNSHLHPYKVEHFEIRIRQLVAAIKLLIQTKPGITVLIKGPHVYVAREFPTDIHLSLVFMDILQREFREIQDHVIYLDVWEICIAQNSAILHPVADTLKSQVQQFMSYVCPGI